MLFGKGQLLDANRYYIILPDAIGHGASSKPSDGLHARFPQYAYEDMVRAQYALLTQGLHIDHLRLLMGTSMGCMHTWMWAERYPAFMDAAMPLACLPVQIAGRNRLWRDLAMDSIRTDPEWLQGEYRTEPMQALRAAAGFLLIAGSAPIQMQIALPTRDAADEFLKMYMDRQLPDLDANDLLYQINASRDYDPSGGLDKIQARIIWINSADDFINPPELGIAEREVKKIKNARFVLIAGLRSNARARHAHLGGGLAAVSERTARREPRARQRNGAAASNGHQRPSGRRRRARAPARTPASGTARPPRRSRSRARCARPASCAREWPRGRSRDRCTGPEAHAHQAADDDAARRPPMPHRSRARRSHRDGQPVIEPRAVLRVRLEDAHRLALAVGGGPEFLHHAVVEPRRARAARSRR